MSETDTHDLRDEIAAVRDLVMEVSRKAAHHHGIDAETSVRVREDRGARQVRSGLLHALRGGQDPLTHPDGHVDPGSLRGRGDDGLLRVVEPDSVDVLAGVGDGRTSGPGSHGVDYTGHVKSLTRSTLEATINAMTTTAPAAIAPIYYEVVWGCDERDRTVRVDYRDGSAISSGVDMRATKVFIDMQAAGVDVAFYVDGELRAGKPHSCELCTPAPAVHKTRTYARKVGERYVTKSNGSCGRWRPEVETTWFCSCGSWGFGRNNDREDARFHARLHREDPETNPGCNLPRTFAAESSVSGQTEEKR